VLSLRCVCALTSQTKPTNTSSPKALDHNPTFNILGIVVAAPNARLSSGATR
jgi:hypothetical protein